MILTKQGTDTIHAVIPKKYQKYPSMIILKHASVLDKVNKLPYVILHNMTPHDAYSITVHVCTMTIEDISHKKRLKYYQQKNRTLRHITQYFNYAKTCMFDLSSDANNTPKTNTPRLTDPNRNWRR